MKQPWSRLFFSLILAGCWAGAPEIRWRTRTVFVHDVRPCLDPDVAADQVPVLSRTSCDGLSEEECAALEQKDLDYHYAQIRWWAADVFGRCRGAGSAQ